MRNDPYFLIFPVLQFACTLYIMFVILVRTLNTDFRLDFTK